MCACPHISLASPSSAFAQARHAAETCSRDLQHTAGPYESYAAAAAAGYMYAHFGRVRVYTLSLTLPCSKRHTRRDRERPREDAEVYITVPAERASEPRFDVIARSALRADFLQLKVLLITSFSTSRPVVVTARQLVLSFFLRLRARDRPPANVNTATSLKLWSLFSRAQFGPGKSHLMNKNRSRESFLAYRRAKNIRSLESRRKI